jgi:hypothetical protein
MPTWLAILLGIYWLAVVAVVTFTALRLVGNLKALGRALTRLNEQLTPALEELAEHSQEAAELAARLAGRGAAAGRDRRGRTRRRGGRR